MSNQSFYGDNVKKKNRGEKIFKTKIWEIPGIGYMPEFRKQSESQQR